MPLHALRCLNGHASEQYVHCAADRGCATRLCACGETLAPVPGYPQVLRYFSEKSPRRIMNLDRGQTEIRSHAQHQALMRATGREPATEWGMSMKPSKL